MPNEPTHRTAASCNEGQSVFARIVDSMPGAALVLLFAISESGFAQVLESKDYPACMPPPGTASIWEWRVARFLVIGELHGTRETPHVFGELVCSAATDARRRVLVGLEFPESARPAFDAYMASMGTAMDRSAFLAASGWSNMARQFPDGRTSEAMLAMLERLRALRAGGLDIVVTTFQRARRSTPSESQTPYEVGMAESLREAFDSGAHDLAIVLVGSLHARRTTVMPSDRPPFDPMAMHLPPERTLALNAVIGDGEAWNCQGSDCGVHKRKAQPPSIPPGVLLGDTFLPGYDGVIGIGPITASLPTSDDKP
jgi:hypothetical protein